MKYLRPFTQYRPTQCVQLDGTCVLLRVPQNLIIARVSPDVRPPFQQYLLINSLHIIRPIIHTSETSQVTSESTHTYDVYIPSHGNVTYRRPGTHESDASACWHSCPVQGKSGDTGPPGARGLYGGEDTILHIVDAAVVIGNLWFIHMFPLLHNQSVIGTFKFLRLHSFLLWDYQSASNLRI